MGRVENLRPWKPGQSGNPGGRPKSRPITEMLATVLDECLEPEVAALMRLPNGTKNVRGVVQAVVRQAMRGDVLAFKVIQQLIEGKDLGPAISFNLTLGEILEATENTGEVPEDLEPIDIESREIEQAMPESRFPTLPEHNGQP